MKTKSSFVAILAAAILPVVSPTQAQVVTLTDVNSTVQINTGSSAGAFNWIVDGQDRLAQQWFWFRVGSAGGEAAINTISAPTIGTPNAKTLNVSYNNASYGVAVNYTLNGQANGSGLSGLGELIRITNSTASALDFHFFQYSDFDLGAADSIQLTKNPGGSYIDAYQTGTGGTIGETVVTPGANHGEAALFPFTLNRLNDGLTTTLNDNNLAGPGDVTWGFEWDLTVAAGSSVDINKALSLTGVVPEPSSLALVSLGLAACAIRKRRQSSR